jgi:hypothetical protein
LIAKNANIIKPFAHAALILGGLRVLRDKQLMTLMMYIFVKIFQMFRTTRRTSTMNKQIITVVDAPKITLEAGEKAGDVLLKFFRALGWNGEDFLDPCKIRTTKAVFDNLYDTMYEKFPEPVGVGMHMCNCGPGTETYIPAGKVYLLEGWVKPEKPHIEGTCPVCRCDNLDYNGGGAEDDGYINKWECAKCETQGWECYKMLFEKHEITWEGEYHGEAV